MALARQSGRRHLLVTGGLAGEASLALALRLTVPLTTSPLLGLENVTAGGVLSTRVEIAAEVCVLPAASVATTRRSYRPSAPSVVSQLAGWLLKLPPCGASS